MHIGHHHSHHHFSWFNISVVNNRCSGFNGILSSLQLDVVVYLHEPIEEITTDVGLAIKHGVVC